MQEDEPTVTKNLIQSNYQTL